MCGEAPSYQADPVVRIAETRRSDATHRVKLHDPDYAHAAFARPIDATDSPSNGARYRM